MKIAIVHYWFLTPGGGENVTEALATIFPEADIFCLFADLDRLPAGISKSRVHTSFLNTVPLAHRVNRSLFPLFSAAAGSFHLSKYDLVISSDSAPTKGIVTSPDAVHISYCHTPGRYIWDLAPSFTAVLPWLFRPLFAEMAYNARTADYVAAQRIDHFIANSNCVARRIKKYYGRNSTVIYPPVNISRWFPAVGHDDYYLSVGRLVENKRIDLLIHACNKLGRRLLIVGEGREEKALKAIAGPTIEFLGRRSREELDRIYARSRAFLFAADEDFGIVSVEAQSFGKPVIAYACGGSLETVRVSDPEGKPDTGVFFNNQTPESLASGILEFESREHQFSAVEICEHASTFDGKIFRDKVADFVGRAMAAKTLALDMSISPRDTDTPRPWDGVTERRAPRKFFPLRHSRAADGHHHVHTSTRD